MVLLPQLVQKLGGVLEPEVDGEVAAICAGFMDTLARDGVSVEQAHPDFSGFEEAFQVPRALGYYTSLSEKLAHHRELIKPEVVWNAERGLALDGDAFREGFKAHGTVFNAASAFMQDYDLLICPAAAVLPFPVEERYVGYGAGLPWSQYLDWLRICYAITTTSLPVITIPIGKSEAGLPVAVQLVGKPHSEALLFSLARHLEALSAWQTAVITPARP